MFRQIKSGHASFIRRMDPYALVTIAPNWKQESLVNQAHVFRRLKKFVSDISLRMDQQFLGTRRVVDRCGPPERFQAICFPEKLLSYPHAHCLMHLWPSDPNLELEDLRAKEVERRIQFLLTAMATEPLGEIESTFLDLCPEPLSKKKSSPILKRLIASAGCDVRIVKCLRDLPEYVLKEYNMWRSEEMTDFFLFGEFHSSRSRFPA